MSIIEEVKQLTPAEQAVKKIKEISTMMMLNNINSSNEIYDLVWHNGDDYNPNDIFNLLGTDALALFQASSHLENFIKVGKPDYTAKPAMYPWHIKEDMTIEVDIPSVNNLI